MSQTVEKQSTALHQAVIEGDVNRLQNELSNGVDPFAQDSYGRTALHYAFMLPYIYSEEEKNTALMMANVLIQKAPDALLMKDKAGDTPLHLMASNDDFIHFLKDAVMSTADLVTMQNNEGAYPIHIAIANQQQESTHFLLEQPGMFSLVDSYGNTLLHHAVMQNNISAVHRLFTIKESLDVNAVNHDGQTALQLNLVNHLSPEIRDILIEHGASSIANHRY